MKLRQAVFYGMVGLWGIAPRSDDEGKTMAGASETIEIAAGEVAAELKRRGISSDERVIVTIERERELIPGRRASRARVVVAGLTDDDIERSSRRPSTKSSRSLDEGRR
jgi:hypothetical protein